MSGDSAISVENVSKRYRLYKERSSSLKEVVTRRSIARYEEFWALKDVSLEVERGTVYGLVGHNGSGKSTLLRMMAGIQRPEKGKVRIRGRVSALLELGAGFHPELTGRENVFLNAAILGLPRKEIEGLFDDIVEFSGLGEFIDTPVKVYSSGMYVRLGFSVAVHVHPEILIIDEVIAVGDEEFQRRCFEYLYKIRNQGVTIVMVTHGLGIVQNMCDRAAWMDHGEVRAEGPAPDVVFEYVQTVNKAEEARLDVEEATGGMRTETDLDAGMRPIRVERVEFLNGRGETVHTASTGDPLKVRLHYHAREPVEGPLFSFAIENHNGLHVATPGMRPTHRHEGMVQGDGYVDYDIDRLVLGAGDYTLSLAIHDANGMVRFDHQDRAVQLRVQPGREQIAGVVDLMGRWQPAVSAGG
ncbi:MAG TPA: ABC transporter ATP-binding protein [Acidimicrobiales bacterium]|nr:ABC transporter ATP-binding protein [Acidimicrobiales bacterium]